MTPEQIHLAAIRAGAAKFYPERQSDFGKSDTYLVSSGFLERFAAEIVRTQNPTSILPVAAARPPFPPNRMECEGSLKK